MCFNNHVKNFWNEPLKSLIFLFNRRRTRVKIMVFLLASQIGQISRAQVDNLTHFQQEAKDCLPGLKKLKGLKSFDGVYKSVSDQYLLSSEQNIYREVIFKTKNVEQKLKITKEKLELFKVDDEGRLEPTSIDAQQKFKTVSAQASQILNRANISFDWHKTVEIREGSLTIEVVKKDGKIFQLSIEDRKTKRKLDCNSLNDSEVCICQK